MECDHPVCQRLAQIHAAPVAPCGQVAPVAQIAQSVPAVPVAPCGQVAPVAQTVCSQLVTQLVPPERQS